MIATLIKHIRLHGIRRTIATAVEYADDTYRDWVDAGFDRKYGTDTSGIIDDMNELGVHTRNREHACGYQGIQIPIFRRIMADLGVDPRGLVFVDFGSGKGRAVMLAAARQFAAVHGVEFSPVLHMAALRNAELFQRQYSGASPIMLHCLDAADFNIPAGDLVCFFYNPFDGNVMAKVLDNLAAAYARAPRRIVIAYRNPVCADVFDAHPSFKLASTNPTYRIYAAIPSITS